MKVCKGKSCDGNHVGMCEANERFEDALEDEAWFIRAASAAKEEQREAR